MNTPKQICDNAMQRLQHRLDTESDENVTEISPGGKTIHTSKIVGEERVEFFKYIQNLIRTEEIDYVNATKATQLFGKKTASLYWQ